MRCWAPTLGWKGSSRGPTPAPPHTHSDIPSAQLYPGRCWALALAQMSPLMAG